MPNPQIIPCPDGQWTLLATGVTTGQLIKKQFDRSYTVTYRTTGSAAPSGAPVEGKAMLSDSLPIFARPTEPVDIYAYTSGGAGLLEVDV